MTFSQPSTETLYVMLGVSTEADRRIVAVEERTLVFTEFSRRVHTYRNEVSLVGAAILDPSAVAGHHRPDRALHPSVDELAHAGASAEIKECFTGDHSSVVEAMLVIDASAHTLHWIEEAS